MLLKLLFTAIVTDASQKYYAVIMNPGQFDPEQSEAQSHELQPIQFVTELQRIKRRLHQFLHGKFAINC